MFIVITSHGLNFKHFGFFSFFLYPLYFMHHLCLAGMTRGIPSWSGLYFLLMTQTAGVQTLGCYFLFKTLCATYIFNTSACRFLIFHFWILYSGSMEFVVPPADSSVFFPISVQFLATNTFSDLKVCSCFLFDIITGYVSEVLSVSFAFCFTCFAPVNCNKHMCFIAIHI